MFSRDGVTYEFHHMGIPTTDAQPNERYSPALGLFTSDSACQLLRIQWHRFDANSPADPLIKAVPHPAFKVNDLGRAIVGRTLLLGPYEPIEGYRVAIIVDGGIPIELIETQLSDDEIWNRAQSGEKSALYAATSFVTASAAREG